MLPFFLSAGICVKKAPKKQMFLVSDTFCRREAKVPFVENTGYLKQAETIVPFRDEMHSFSEMPQLLGGFLQAPQLSLASLVKLLWVEVPGVGGCAAGWQIWRDSASNS